MLTEKVDTKLQVVQKLIVYLTGLIADPKPPPHFVETWKDSLKKNERANIRLGVVKKEMGNIKPELMFGLSSYMRDNSNSPNHVYLEDLGKDWSNSSDTYNAMTLHGYIEEMGVKCSYRDEGDRASVRLKETDRIANYTERKEALQEMYVYQQAVFKHLKITHIDLYRGILDPSLNTEPPTHGDRVQIRSRPLTSWTSNPEIAFRFGYRIVKCRVPVENIIASPMIHPRLRDEFEYVVMGAEGLECEVFMGVFFSQ